jgi:predicted house-cleaning noncanonical NTP pyrophosphatase (MazG superfamily)
MTLEELAEHIRDLSNEDFVELLEFIKEEAEARKH